MSEETLLTETRRRLALVVPAHRTLVVVDRAHERFYTPLLANVRTRLVVAQPENRGIAPALLYALLVLAARRPRATAASCAPLLGKGGRGGGGALPHPEQAVG